MRLPWWQRGAIYQIYPRSFADSDGDGIGDLRGVVEHLDHLVDLGVVGLWLSPIFPSPMADGGYDVTDHCDVDPQFGTLEDLDRLIDDAHARGLRVMLDWIPNHTSDRHPWFLHSRASRDSERRDWYVWADGSPGGGPPNDWRSHFPAVGPAWSYDARMGQWYLHSFMPEQPDLNWDNQLVREAMCSVLRFWLDRGVDGFRLDAVSSIAKDPRLGANAGSTRRHDEDWDTIHERLREIRAVVDEYDDRMIVGEVLPMNVERIVSYLATDQLHLVHNFVFVEQEWTAASFRDSIEKFCSLADASAWPSWFLGNHDYSRVATRFDQNGHGAARARAAALLLYSLRGTPFLYQGEELGLPDADVPHDRARDVAGRDPARSPMPWRRPSAAGPGAGFTRGNAWLPPVAAAEELCVEAQAEDPRSTLALVRTLAGLREHSSALRTGTQRMLSAGEDVLAWLREYDGDRLLAAVNFSPVPAPLALDVALPPRARLVVSTDPARTACAVELASLMLGPSEAVLVEL